MARRDRFDQRPEDAFVKSTLSFIEYLSLHKTAFTVALVAVGLAALAVLAYWNHVRSYSSSALRALELAHKADDYKNVAESYPGSQAEPLALFLRGRRLMDEKQYGEAFATLSSLVSSYPDHPIAPAAEMLRGMLLEQEKKYEDAAGRYEALLSKYPGSFVSPLAMLHLGGCYEKTGRADDAKGAYERLIAEHEDSAWKADAEKRLAKLGAGTSS